MRAPVILAVALGMLLPAVVRADDQARAGTVHRTVVVQGGTGSWIGVGVTDVTADKVAALKLKEERGVEIVTVSPDSPAQQAGLKEHDVVLEFNGERDRKSTRLNSSHRL